MSRAQHDWFILCTASADTLRLAQSLAWADIEAWSPAETLVEREGECRSRRTQRVPLLKGYVFVRAEHRVQIIEIHEALSNPHPHFWFMRDQANGGMQMVPDRALDGLRVAEQKVSPAEHIRQWKPGELVRYPASGFEGMVGTIVRVSKKSAWVNFGGLLGEAETVPALLLDAGEPERLAA